GHVELHAVSALLDGPFALALRADARLLDHAVAVAIRAGVLARDVQSHDAATNCRPERHVDLIFEIAAGLGALRRETSAAAAAENSRKDVAESAATARSRTSARASTFEHVAEIESAEVESLSAAGSRLSAGKSSETSRSGWAAARIGFGGSG